MNFLLNYRSIFFLIIFLSIEAYSQGIFDKMLNSPMRLKIGNSLGSGVLYNDSTNIFLITARHVLFDELKTKVGEKNITTYQFKGDTLKMLCYGFNSKTTDLMSGEYTFSINELIKMKLVMLSYDNDIAVIHVAKFGQDKKDKSREVIWMVDMPITDDSTSMDIYTTDRTFELRNIQPGSDIFIFGYPVSLGTQKQFDVERPLLRRGIIAGRNFNNRTLILDCTIYQGNSGGPVMMAKPILDATRYYLVGIVTEWIPFVDTLESKSFGYKNIIAENSGLSVAVSIDEALQLIKDYYANRSIK